MAFKLDNDLLEELGLAALSADEKQAMLRQILETLEMRVGTTLASKMTDAQLDEFEQLMPAEGDSQETVQQKEQYALQWLETNFPNYKQVVNEELEKLKAEIRQTAPQIVAASQQNLAPVSSTPQPSFEPTSQPAFSPAPAHPVVEQPQFQPSYQSPVASAAAPPYQPQVPPQQPPAQAYAAPAPQQPAPGFASPAIPTQQPAPFSPSSPLPPSDNDQRPYPPYPPQAA